MLIISLTIVLSLWCDNQVGVRYIQLNLVYFNLENVWKRVFSLNIKENMVAKPDSLKPLHLPWSVYFTDVVFHREEHHYFLLFAE